MDFLLLELNWITNRNLLLNLILLGIAKVMSIRGYLAFVSMDSLLFES